MHRMFSAFRRLGWSLLTAVAVHAGSSQLTAQELAVQPAPGKVDSVGRVIVVPPNITKTLGMSRPAGATEDPIIQKVHNENPKVVRVTSILDDPRHVLVTGLTPGTSRLTFTGKDMREEVLEVRVPSDEEPIREEQRKDFLAAVKRAAPTANIDAVVLPNNTIIISGWLATPGDTATVMAAARAIFGANANVVDTMRITGVMQVQVECVVAVVNRSKIRNATFNWIINRRDYFVS